jgi:hypothetical protein
MSDSKVISDVDQTLGDLVSGAIDADAGVQALLAGAADRVVFDSPGAAIQAGNQACVSIFLYRVVENPDLKNRPPIRVAPDLLRRAPLALNLYYLVTPLLRNTQQSHWLLGRVMQEFADNPVIQGTALAGGLRDAAEELRIALDPITLEDLTKLWTTFASPYRVGVSYQVRVVLLDSERVEQSARVRLKRLEMVHGTEAP